MRKVPLWMLMWAILAGFGVSLAPWRGSIDVSPLPERSLFTITEPSLPKECRNHTSKSRYDPLACWLLHLKVSIPDQSFSKAFLTIEIRDLSCTNFVVEDIDSSYDPSNRNASTSDQNTGTDPLLDLSVANISALCHGSYKSSGVGGNMQAQLQADAGSTNPALAWSLLVQSDHNNSAALKQPVGVVSSHFAATLAVTDLHFTGSASAKIINLFSTTIKHYVSDALGAQLGPLIKSSVDPLLTQYLRIADDFLRPYLGQARERTAERQETESLKEDRELPDQRRLSMQQFGTVATASLVDFTTELPVLTGSLKILNEFTREYLQQGFLQHWLPRKVVNYAVSPFEIRTTAPDEHCGFLFDGVNGIIQSILHNTNGTIHLPVPPRLERISFVLAHYGEIELQLHDWSLSGLDQWEVLRVLDPRDAHEFVTRFVSVGKISLRSDVKLIVTGIPGGVFQGDPLEESFAIHLNSTALDILAVLSAQVDRFGFQNVTVGMFLDALQGLFDGDHSRLPCLVAPIQSLFLSEFAARLNLNGIRIIPQMQSTRHLKTEAASLEQDLDVLLNHGLDLFLTEYQPFLTQALYGLSYGPVETHVNEFLKTIVTHAQDGICPLPPSDESYPQLVNFTRIPWLERFQAFSRLPSTLERINDFLVCTSNYLTGAILEQLSSSLDSGMPRKDVGSSVIIKELAVLDVGSVRDFRVLSSERDGMHLYNKVDYGTGNATSALPPRLAVSVEATYAPANVSAALNITIQLDDMHLMGGSILHYDINRLKGMPLAQVLRRGQCGLAPMNEFNLYGYSGQLGAFGALLNATVNSNGSNTIFIIGSDKYPSVNETASAILAWVVRSTRDILSLSSVSMLARADDLCKDYSIPERKRNDDANGPQDDMPSAASILLVVAACFLLAQPALLLLHRTPDAMPDSRLTGVSLTEPLLPSRLTDSDCIEDMTTVDRVNDSMMHSPYIPGLVRVVVPIGIIGTIVLLLASNLSIGANVDLVISLGDKTIQLPSLFTFGLLNTARDMLKARIYPLFLLVVVFSGIWPYVKLVLMFVAWVVPKASLSPDFRGRMLMALDSLGKFSLVDTYVLVLMLVAFRYHLDVTNEVEVDVYVSPGFGFYGFLLATSLSLIAGHLLVFFHRRCEIHLVNLKTIMPLEPICEHLFNVEGGLSRKLSGLCQRLLLGTSFATIILLGVGMARKSFQFEFDGLAGLALGDKKIAEYSLLSLGSSIPMSVQEPLSIGIRCLQLAFYFYAVVTPFVCLTLLTILFVWPLSLQRQLLVLTLAEIANAWSAIEVFALSIVAALLQISTFSSFIIGHRCDLINDILKEYFAETDTDHATCYTVRSTVKWDAAFLVAGVLLNSLVVSLTLRVAHAAVDERQVHESALQMDSPLSGSRPPRHSIVAGWAQSPWTSWMLQRPTNEENSSHVSSVVGPPANALVEPSSPWKQNGFTDEWKEAAERDPAWKEWKEATNVT